MNKVFIYLLLFIGLLPYQGFTQATVLEVNSLLDEVGDQQTRTLRGAMLELEQLTDPVIIRFQLPTIPPNPVITLREPLPAITRGEWTIDGAINASPVKVVIDANQLEDTVFYIQGYNEIEIKNMVFRNASAAVHVNSGDDLALNNLELYQSRYAGLHIESSSNVRIENTRIDTAQYGIFSDRSNTTLSNLNEISNCEIGVFINDAPEYSVLIGDEPNFIYSNQTGIYIKPFENQGWNSGIIVANSYLGFSPQNIDTGTGDIIEWDPMEANVTGIEITGDLSDIQLSNNKHQYYFHGVTIDTAYDNRISNCLFFKVFPATIDQFLPVELNLMSSVPGNSGKSPPIINQSIISQNGTLLTIEGTSQPEDFIELYFSDSQGNIRNFLGIAYASSTGEWSYTNNTIPFNNCLAYHFAVSTTDVFNTTPTRTFNTSPFAYTGPVSEFRLVQPELSFEECSGWQVFFQDQSLNAQIGDSFELMIEDTIISGYWPLDATLDLSFLESYGDYPISYKISTNNCSFFWESTIHVSPSFDPEIFAEYNHNANSITAYYTQELLNVAPQFYYQWEYFRMVNNEIVEEGKDSIRSAPSTSDRIPFVLNNVNEGRYYVRLALGIQARLTGHPCTRYSPYMVPEIPLRASFSSTSANCGSDGTASISVQTGIPPFSYYLNNVEQTTAQYSNLTPGFYELNVSDNFGNTITEVVEVENGSPQVALETGDGPCSLSPGRNTNLQFQVDRSGANSNTYNYEIIQTITNHVLSSGLGIYSQTQNIAVAGLLSGDQIAIRISDAQFPDCDYLSESVLVRSPALNFELDQPNGIYASCDSGNADVSISASITLNGITSPTPTQILNYQLQRQLPNRQYENFGALISSNLLQYTFSDLPPGQYRILITYHPNGFNCQRQLSFQILSPSQLAADPPIVEQVSCNGRNDGNAQIRYRNSSGQVQIHWYALQSPEDTLSYSPRVNGLAPGDYVVKIKDERTCQNEELEYQFSITEPTTLGPVSVNAVPEECLLEASFPAGQGTAPYSFSWRNAENQEVRREEGLLPDGGIVRSVPDLTSLPPGEYYVVVQDARSCLVISPKIELVQPELERTYDLCIRWVSPGIPPKPKREPSYVRPSIEELQGKAVAAIENQISDCISEQLLSLDAYSDRCYDPAFMADTMTLAYQLSYHHNTLFYHDRAGNLVQTIPPKGVDSTLTNRDRFPKHTFATNYQYNSLGQLKQQSTPDGGTTRFLYNDLNQLRFSQNARQADPQDLENIELDKSRYSYSKYDKLGRIIEVGESFLEANESFEDLNTPEQLQEDPDFPTATNSRDVTHTVFSDADSSVTYLGLTTQHQRYLDNRISYAWRANQNGDTVRTFYSYDPHGNIEWMVQDLPEIGKSYIGYKYDLLSGNILEVKYNEGYIDQFFHRYKYDEDNRLRQVETSRDGYLWDRDARYQYYTHGPIKNMILGEDQVQKVDYTYTIQGWLKGINTPDLTINEEEGPGQGKAYPQDVFGMALGYYPGDFRHTGSLFDANGVYSLSDFSISHALYNGNIAAWSSKIGFENTDDPFSNQLTASRYDYDRLNRLRASTFHTFDGTNYLERPNDLGTSYTYDPNGNFLTLNRKGLNNLSGNVSMDEFSYAYYPNSNRLRQVSDAITYPTPNDDPYELDIKAGQDSLNYVYDAAGNLIEDKQEGLTFKWDAYGKLMEVQPTFLENSDNQKSRLYFSYDPLGNRVIKEVNTSPYDSLGQEENKLEAITTDYYLRGVDQSNLAINKRTNQRDGNFYTANFWLDEQTISGAKRLGLFTQDSFLLGSWRFINDGDNSLSLFNNRSIPEADHYFNLRLLGDKNFELSDHLDNTIVVVKDQKQIDNANNQFPTLLAYSNYYPYGMSEPNRSYSLNNYRYGFGGMEKDDEVDGSGNSYTTLYRQYDPRLGRWKSLDPKARDFPWQSPYVGMDNKPIIRNDANGDCPTCGAAAVGAGLGAAMEMVIQISEHMFQGMSFDAALSKVNYMDVVKEAAIGGLAGLSGFGAAQYIAKATKVLKNPASRMVLAIATEAIIDYSVSTAAGYGYKTSGLEAKLYRAMGFSEKSNLEVGQIGEKATLKDLEKQYGSGDYTIEKQVTGTFDDGTKTIFDFVVKNADGNIVEVAESKANTSDYTTQQRRFWGRKGESVSIGGQTVDPSNTKIKAKTYRVDVNRYTGSSSVRSTKNAIKNIIKKIK